MSSLNRIEALIGPSLQDMGYDIVRLQLSGAERPQLQIMIDRLDEAPVSVDDCADVSRAVSALLDVEDPITGAYTLEVSSPGIDRPLTRLKDFDRFDGFEAKIELKQAVEGQRRFRGRLDGVEGDEVRLATDQGILGFALEMIDQAKLVMTDELLKMAGASGQPDTDSQ